MNSRDSGRDCRGAEESSGRSHGGAGTGRNRLVLGRSNRLRSRNGSGKGVIYESTDSFVVAYSALALDAIGVFTAA